MPGRFIVLVRGDVLTPWTVAAAGVDAAGAQARVDTLLASNVRARIVIAQAVRSFTITPAAAEDGVLTVDP